MNRQRYRDFARSVIETLESLGFVYFIGGSFASMYYGEMRMTQYKLKYYLSGRIDKHLRDIAAMLTVQGDDLDSDYIEQWAARIGATDLWHALVGEYHRRIRAQATPE